MIRLILIVEIFVFVLKGAEQAWKGVCACACVLQGYFLPALTRGRIAPLWRRGFLPPLILHYELNIIFMGGFRSFVRYTCYCSCWFVE